MTGIHTCRIPSARRSVKIKAKSTMAETATSNAKNTPMRVSKSSRKNKPMSKPCCASQGTNDAYR